ncbi:MFS transporter [Gaoshiqia sp. Z1-71]|uniref:MFS transporter n=1 Tax=Gaoshiqia hydrogeniformans TaxID=3290090 RepID=UPI003BF8B4E6
MDKNQSILSNRNLHIVFCVTLAGVMGVASITPAFPAIIRYFEITPRQVGWLIVLFTLPGVVLTPLTGILADRYGRKPILVPSLFLFGLAGFTCFFIRDYQWLLFFRFIQGIGASSLSSMGITLIGDIFPGKKRVAAMGYNASILSVGTAMYPAIGGVLAALDWPFIFLLPVLAIPLGLWVIYGLRNPEPSSERSLKDYFGNVWQTINRRTVWGLFLTNILLFIILYGAYLTYFPLLLATHFGAGSATIGVTMSLMSLVTAITSFNLPYINRFLSAKKQLAGACGFYFLSMLVLSMSARWEMVIAGVLFLGLGHGVMVPSVQTLLVGMAGIEERAAFMSLNAMLLRSGQTIGPLLIGFFYAAGDLQAAFGAGAGLAVLMVLLIVTMVKA